MSLAVTVLGGFTVVADGVAVPPDAWARRHAAALVKLLVLTPGHRLHREQVLDALWPGVDPEAATPRLHKAAHYARRALGSDVAVVLRQEGVTLGGEVHVDVEAFEARGRAALAAGSPELAGRALGEYGGPLLPEDVYEEWTSERRHAVAVLHLDLLRLAERWADLLAEDPLDEQAHLALARGHAERGDVRAALRQLERLDQALRHGLGTTPGPEVQTLRARLEARAPAAGSPPWPPVAPAEAVGRTITSPPVAVPPEQRAAGSPARLFGRRSVGDELRRRIAEAETGRGSTLLVSGPSGVGKTAVLELVVSLVERRGWRVGRGSASAVEGPWPYAPVLEALGDLCRRHPALLDGLEEVYRQEIERALSGRDVTWSGESGHQRLFVAVTELVRLAAAGHGLLLVVDDLHEADEASLRLLHYLSRCVTTEPVLVVLAHRPVGFGAVRDVLESLVARGGGSRVELRPLDPATMRRLLAGHHPELSPEAVEGIVEASGGLPFTALEMARHDDPSAGRVLPVLPPAQLRTLQRVALLGTTFSTDELLTVAGVDEDAAYRHLDAALHALVVEPGDAGYRFRHPMLREALLRSLSPSEEAAARRDVAEALVRTGAPPGRVAHQYLAAGLPRRAVPFVLRAVETAGALGAYRDALALVDGVLDQAGPDALPRLLVRRGDLLMAMGDADAVEAYRRAVAVTEGVDHRLVRARMARAAAFAGDLDTAEAALAGLELEGDAADPSILLALGNVAYFSGRVDEAWQVTMKARDLLRSPDDPWHIADLISLQGLIAHQRGEWFDRFRLELRRTQGKERLATAVYDAHLCVAEYLLYGPMPYPELIAEAEDLRRRASHAGALRGVAFATALIGEAALLMGDLELAERELLEAVDLHRDIAAPAGEAHSLQRLAEVRLAQGRRDEAMRLLEDALPRGRFTQVALHLVQRVYGSMIMASPDPATARAVVERAEATMGETDRCIFCEVMFVVPAAIACADVGELERAKQYVATADEAASRWEGNAWQAAVLEARAHILRAEGRFDDAADVLAEAAELFRAAGQPMDALRCQVGPATFAGQDAG